MSEARLDELLDELRQAAARGEGRVCTKATETDA
jgi:hypothetical protein